MRKHAIRFPIPERNLRYVELPQDNSYIFFEDGGLYSRKNGKWLTKSNNGHGTFIYMIHNPKTNKSTSFSIKAAIRKYFGTELVDTEDLEHKPIKNFPNYELYQDGRVYSKTHNIFLRGAYHGDKYFVALRNDKKEQITFYPELALDEYFGEN